MKKLTIFLAVIGLITAMFATTMIIHTTGGNETSFEIGNIESITFQNPQPTYLVDENFDSYETGTFPADGNWSLLYNGSGNSDQIVVNSIFNSNPNSMQLKGRTGWGAEMYYSLPEQPSEIFIEAKILSLSGCRTYVGLKNNGESTWGTGYAGFQYVDEEINVWISGNEEAIVITEAVPNVWYKVKIKLNTESEILTTWLNDNLVVENFQGDFSDMEGYQELILAAPNSDSGDFVYFDDVKVWTE